MRALTLVAVATLGSAVSAQQASYSYLWPYGYIPPISYWPGVNALNTPKIGTTFELETGVSSGGATKYLLTGRSNPNLNLAVLFPGIGAGVLYTSGEVAMPLPVGFYGQTHLIRIPIPLDMGLVGVSFYQQTVVVAATSGVVTLVDAFSRGGHGVMGL